jgi:hypothetical protein
VTPSSTSSSEPLRRFLLRLAAFAVVSACSWAACTAVFFNGYTDDHYERISSPRQAALILGTSRAAQGLVPEEIDAALLGAHARLYNFSFTSATSPYGRTYYEAVERKLRRLPPGQRGLFLLEVNPLALSIIGKGQGATFREEQTFLAKLHSVSLEPNIEYPFYVADRGYNIIDRTVRRWRGRDRLFLHADGWLEVTPVEAGRVEENIRQKLEDYAATFGASEYSPERADYLERLLALLTPLGRTALVLVPIDPRLRALERAYMPDFDARMQAFAERWQATYSDLSDLDAEMATNDGNHLRRDASRRVSRELFERLAHAWGRSSAR